MSWEAEEREYIESASRELEDRKKRLLKKEMLSELENRKPVVGVPGSHVYFESEELRKQVEAEVAALPPQPKPEPVFTELNPFIKMNLEAILDTLGYVMVEKDRWENMNKRYAELERFYDVEQNRSRGDGHF